MIDRLIKIYQLSKRAFGHQKKSILFLTFLGFLNGAIAGVGINTIIPIFSFISGDNNFIGSDKISKLIQGVFIFLHIDFRLKYLLIFACLLFIIQGIVFLFSNYFIVYITANYERQMRDLLFSKTIKADWPYLLKQKIGHLETVIANDTRTGSTILTCISGLIITLSSLLIYIVIAINISPRITMVIFIFGILYLIITRPMLIRTKKAGLRTSAMYKEVSHFVNENINGMKAIKIFSADNHIDAIAKKKFLTLRNLRIEVALLGSISGAIIQPLTILFIAGIFVIFYKSSAFNVGAFVALVYLIQKIFSYFNQLQGTLQKAIEAVPYLQSVLLYEDKAVEFKEKIGGQNPFVAGGNLSFDNVSFSYDKNKEVLRGINFDLKKGEVVGLIGPSGAGKTTIADLVLRLFQPTTGKIAFGGIDINDINIKEWRDKIGYVSQDMFLTNDTIENNIKFYNEQISDTDIKLASQKANIYNFIMSHPDNFKKVVGERGNFLSVGQRQRIVIARVLARKPEILVLDEATSALDNESEVLIQQVVEKLKGEMTVLIIAHRLSTIMNCDRLIALNNGAIIEEGKPEELLNNKDSYFYKVYNNT